PCRVILWRRDPDICPKPEGAVATNLRRRDRYCGWGSRCGLCSGLCRFPGAGGDHSQCLRLGDGESLLCRAAEERKDNVQFRSAPGSDLRPGCVSTRGMAAMLVSEPPSGAADRHLAA